MLKPSSQTLKIRRIVEKLSDDDLKSKGPKDLVTAVVKAGLVYADVRENVNNELARARRKRGIRKGRGRRIAAQWPQDETFTRQVRLFTELDRFRETNFESWAECRNVVQDILSFVKRLGSAEDLMKVIEIKQADELAAKNLRTIPPELPQDKN